MKKKNGFTLIELLAVIVILAVIAIIAVPMVTEIIKDSKKSSLKSEAMMIVSTINNYCTSKKILGNGCGTELDGYDGILDIHDLDLSNAEIENDQVKQISITREGITITVTFDENVNDYNYETIDSTEPPKAKYAFGEGNTEWGLNFVDDYKTLNKSVFIKLEGEQMSVCFYKNDKLSCFKSIRAIAEEEQAKLEQAFSDGSCKNLENGLQCGYSDFSYCSVSDDGTVKCVDDAPACTVYTDNYAQCMES